MIGRTSIAPRGRRRVGQILGENVSGYCQSTTIHGFAYWISAPRSMEKLFWVIVVIASLAFPAIILR